MKLIHLSDKFYEDYGGYEEILKKDGRPYVCLEIKIEDHTFAIPFRHHINHRYAFITLPKQGLDYSKAVIITNSQYIADTKPWIETAEYSLLKSHEKEIAKGMYEYYKLFLKSKANQGNKNYQNILRYSSLQYFVT